MKRVHLFFIASTLNFFVQGQITMETNLPSVLPLNSELIFEVKIKKGALTNFSKYQMEVSRDMVIQEVDSKSGTFSFDDNVVKIIWVMTPLEPEINLKLKLNSGIIKGKRNLVQKYFYIENDSKRNVEMESISISVKDTASLQAATVDFYTILPKMPASVITTSINIDEVSLHRPEVLIQQVTQLRKDSKDAYDVGQREKKKAELKLNAANEAITAAASLSSDSERKIALEKANADKQKAEKDLQIAERVLILAKSLDENANDIEKINRTMNPGSFSDQKENPSIAKTDNQSNVKGNTKTTPTTIDLDRLEEVFGPPEGKRKDKSKNETESSSEKELGVIYKIQLGAFSKKPSKSDFKAIGKVKITEDAGMYKVLYGSFKVKEEALKERENIIAKGFDGFVVTYQDGQRLK